MLTARPQLQALQSQGKTGTDLLQLATNTLEVMKESLSHVLPGSAFPAVGDFSQLQTFYSTILTQLQSQGELLPYPSRLKP